MSAGLESHSGYQAVAQNTTFQCARIWTHFTLERPTSERKVSCWLDGWVCADGIRGGGYSGGRMAAGHWRWAGRAVAEVEECVLFARVSSC
jgi:hypothetical protein